MIKSGTTKQFDGHIEKEEMVSFGFDMFLLGHHKKYNKKQCLLDSQRLHGTVKMPARFSQKVFLNLDKLSWGSQAVNPVKQLQLPNVQ